MRGSSTPAYALSAVGHDVDVSTMLAAVERTRHVNFCLRPLDAQQVTLNDAVAVT